MCIIFRSEKKRIGVPGNAGMMEAFPDVGKRGTGEVDEIPAPAFSCIERGEKTIDESHRLEHEVEGGKKQFVSGVFGQGGEL